MPLRELGHVRAFELRIRRHVLDLDHATLGEGGPPRQLDRFGCNLSYGLGLPTGLHLTLITLPGLSGEGPGVSPGRKPTAGFDMP